MNVNNASEIMPAVSQQYVKTIEKLDADLALMPASQCTIDMVNDCKNELTLAVAHLHLAEETAREWHAEQKRKNGAPYITHVEAVVYNVWQERCSVMDDFAYFKRSGFADALTVAWLHDVLEDTDYPDDKLEHLSGNEISKSVRLLTKPKDKSRFDYHYYLNAIRRDDVACAVKLADFKHNLSDLKPGNLRDKYVISVAYLKQI